MAKHYKRFFVIVADSAGVGEEPDAAKFGDVGSNTWAHAAESVGGLKVPFMEAMGIGELDDILGVKAIKDHKNAYSLRLRETSNGKDTMTGHWEMMGVNTQKPFQTFTDTGFPQELIDELEERTGHKIIGNYSASGTAILVELGEQQMKENSLIVYTSADSVLQIAAHEEVTGLDELYRCCEIAREICMKPEWMVGRVIARPYVGKTKETFKRTSNRHDLALKPTLPTVMNVLQENGYCHYEISNFAKKGFESKHNSNCWKQHSYLGFGVAAHSYYDGIRYSNITDLKTYIENLQNGESVYNIIFHEKQSKEQMMKEYMLLGLRKIDGVKISEFKEKFVDNPLYYFREQLNKLVKQNLVEVSEDRIYLTDKGLDLANIVWMEFI